MSTEKTRAPALSASGAASSVTRRSVLVGSVAAATALAMPAIAQARTKVKLGYWPISGGLAFFSAVEEGYFAEAGIDIEAVKFAGPNQVVEAIIAGRVEGSANGTSSPTLALADAQAPGSIKLFCLNFANATYVIDHIIVPKDSTLTSVKEIAGKRYACGPGINNVTLAKAVLEGAGIAAPKVIELPVPQLLPALAAGQVDAAYVLEPTAVVGRKQNISKILETAVVSRYVFGNPQAPWFGGAASLSADFIARNPAAAKAVIGAYAKGVAYVRDKKTEANKYLKGYTAIEGDLISEVPVSGYRMYSEMTPDDWAMTQKLFDLFFAKKVVMQELNAARMAYQG
ncbi:ABC transporter substrate-binding protein [Aquabacter spiritensis]|uniref:NitT/TauT family transport system substrate-binding protein n=1 Tax=Aquabacter spiritensis TaxID=933073 RepID=A0A4R3M0V3_9HYPH|nr:ABC transporter substrate-binding protein [Aquabacter spiritensis]TCT06670.1 NitT/TauT family transport system substrate-binding protein [Aquabacter spiritensis]